MSTASTSSGRPSRTINLKEDNASDSQAADDAPTSKSQPETTTQPVDKKAAKKAAKKAERAAKKAAKDAARPKAPTDVLIPTQGWPGIKYEMRCMLRRPDKVPAISKAERIELESAVLKSLLRTLAHVVHMKVAFLNYNGGGSKTTTAVNVGNVIAYYTDAVVRVLPASRNPGTTAMKADGAPNTLTLLALSQHPDRYKVYTLSSKAIIKNAAGLGVIRHDSKTRVDENFGGEEFKLVVDVLEPTTDVLLMDGGNNSALGAELMAAMQAEVLCFTCSLHSKTESRLFMGYTMDDFAKETGLGDKVKHAITVFSEVKKGEALEDFAKYATQTIDENDKAVAERDYSGPMVGIPMNDFMAKHIVVHVSDMSPDVLYAYLKLALELFLSAAKHQEVNLIEALKPFDVDFTKVCAQLGIRYVPPAPRSASDKSASSDASMAAKVASPDAIPPRPTHGPSAGESSKSTSQDAAEPEGGSS